METSNGDERPQAGEIGGEAQARPRLSVEELKERLDEINERIKGFIRERPAACLLGALALGYLVARLARRER
jgi:hypothetical protein